MREEVNGDLAGFFERRMLLKNSAIDWAPTP
jgi:hypothetical protein